MSNTDYVGRRGIIGNLVLVGTVISLAACGSTATASSSSPVSPVIACSLMSKAEAAAIFPTGNYTLQHHSPTNEQTYCVYPGSVAGVSLITKVTWSNSQVTNFEKFHSGTNKLTMGTPSSGQSFPVPLFTKITVDGTTAYWSAHQSIPISGTSTYPSLMSAERNGYVLSLSATGLSEMQNESVMSTMLRRL